MCLLSSTGFPVQVNVIETSGNLVTCHSGTRFMMSEHQPYQRTRSMSLISGALVSLA